MSNPFINGIKSPTTIYMAIATAAIIVLNVTNVLSATASVIAVPCLWGAIWVYKKITTGSWF